MADLYAPPPDAAARRALGQHLKQFNCRVFQADDPPFFTREPASTMQPLHWKWSDLDPLLNRIGAGLSLERGGQRRTLRLTNPGLAFGTTPTFWGSIQYILPGEVATAHRHAPNALRFIMRGSGAFTTVDGQQYPMNEGDLVLTPSMAWHDHEHRGDEPMIWLDVLDISLVSHLHAMFFEGSPDDVQAVDRVPDRSLRQFRSGIMRPLHTGPLQPSSPLLVYDAVRAHEALDAASGLDQDAYDATTLEYQNPLTGGPALNTIGTRLQKLLPGAATLRQRHTGSALNYVVRGHGSTDINGQTYAWGPGDFLAIPPWHWYAHSNTSTSDDAVFFQVNDCPVLQALGLFRTERATSP